MIYIALVVIAAWLLALELRHHSLRKDIQSMWSDLNDDTAALWRTIQGKVRKLTEKSK